MEIHLGNKILEQSRWIPWNLVPSDQPNKKPQKVPAVKWQDFKNRKPFHDINGKKGIVFDPTIDNLVGLDLDDCIVNGKYSDVALKAIELFTDKAYIEVSVSGTGLHFLFYSHVGVSFNEKPIEYYEEGRYFTFSGKSIEGSAIDPINCQLEIESFLKQFTPHQLTPKTKGISLRESSITPISTIKRALAIIPSDCPRDQWFSVACALHSDFDGDDVGFGLFHEWSMSGGEKYISETDCQKTWDSLRNDKGNTIGIGSLFKRAKDIDPSFDQISQLKPSISSSPDQLQFTRDSKGNVYPSIDNLMKLIRTYDIRFDRFKGKIIGLFEGKIRPLVDFDITQMIYKSEQLGFKRTFNKTVVFDNIVLIAHKNSFDSAIDWGNSLNWDGVKRCEKLLSNYFGSEDNHYTNMVSLYMVTGMAARLMNPGYKVDAAVVLYGAQGTGKTTSVQNLAPDDTFGEINFHMKDDDKSRLIKGKLIIELPELRGLKSSSSEDIKAFMSRTHEEFTDKFEKLPHQFPRRCFFIGTTNDKEFMSDSTGNRRWLPISVGNANLKDLKQDRDQIWAEAIVLFQTHGLLWEEAQKAAEDIREEYTNLNPLVFVLRDYFEHNPEINCFISSILYLELTGYAYDQRASYTFNHSMGFIKGWKKAPNALKINKIRGQGYIKSDTVL